jgi:tetratricopeptide (TPR) repeat protein
MAYPFRIVSQHEKTDIFRERVSYREEIKTRLQIARGAGGGKESRLKAINLIVNELVLENEETGVLIDAMLSYRAISAYEEMVRFIETMPAHVRQTVMVREQLGFALNRLNRHKQAIAVLEKVIEENGPSSETYGILGRVYKDLFEKALENDNEFLAEAELERAYETYRKGFEADWRDAYPGVNVVTLLELLGRNDQIEKMAAVVEYAVIRKLDQKTPDYWDYVTLMELAIIVHDATKAKENLRKAIACPIEGEWMFETTIKNLHHIQKFREKRNEDFKLPQEIRDQLQIQKEAYLKKSH